MKSLMDFEPSPERITLYFCKQCERQTVSGNYAPAICNHCEHDEFYSEFEPGAPCNRQEEEENDEEEDPEYFYDGEELFELKKVA
jgi:hypothetical protein